MPADEIARQSPEGVRLRVRVLPRSQPAGPAGVRAGRLLVRLPQAPVDGAANRALTQLLARACGLARGRVTIVAGETSREKELLLEGAELAAVRVALSLGDDPS